MPDQFKIGVIQEVQNLSLFAGKKIIHANHLIPFSKQPLAKVRSHKSGSAGDQNPFHNSFFEATTGFRPIL